MPSDNTIITRKENKNALEAHKLKEALATSQLSMFRFIFDLPNIVTLLGLLSALLGIYAAILGEIYIAAVFGAWSVVFDWLDGLIASKMKNRTNAHRVFGAQLDSLIDMVSFGVLPAIILMSYSDYNPWYIPGAFVIISACAIRLSYFNIYGLTDGKTYTGLAVDYNGLVVSLFFLIESFFGFSFFPEALYLLLFLVACLNLSTIQIPKFPKTILIGIVIYVITLTIKLVYV
ncbi:CDP-alcohol phosphatidyltransferase family protein [Algibacter mikhailovii]|uniref:CDP-alcohol phosphatidyltransferase n=1 Tax=Algibacter mikhailovii TaxID=425498 RepID=A0A918QUR0_9FLAO|nr:CDP-alcohol phosphatidyltransferase family protein [Algibacter mikhailovii]GGZ71634.1 hypothetical protein GCM10007028_06240 [Algibacter mikhailovii]